MNLRNLVRIWLCLGLYEALALGAVSVLLTTPAPAQFWEQFQRPSPPRAGPRQSFSPFGGIFQQPMWQAPAAPSSRRVAPRSSRAQLGDFSKAPAPRRSNTAASVHIVVMGDSMADWLSHGLEEAYADRSEFGVVRKIRTNTGLIPGRSRSRSYDWIASGPELLAQEKPEFIVVLLGLADRAPFREWTRERPSGGRGQASSSEKVEGTGAAQQPPSKATDHEFRSAKWIELYSKRIDDMIAVVKSKGVPVLWVGLPPVRGPRSRSDLAFLNDLYRVRAQKAGITYVDLWDGFIDEDKFSIRGPDYDGQIRQLRSADGVYFTKAGARKLGHYVERDIQRLIAARGKPVALPASEPQQPPGGPVPRPVAGPVIPLVGMNTPVEELAGSGGLRASSLDRGARRVRVTGRAAPRVAGRADDFSWPREGTNNQGIIPATSARRPQRPSNSGLSRR